MQRTALICALAGLLCAGGCHRARNSAATTSDDAPLAIAFSGNTRGYIESCGCAINELGGLARRATLIADLRALRPNLIYLDYGNLLFDNVHRPSSQALALERSKARVIVTGANEMALAAFTPGEGDLIAGLDVLRALLSRAKFAAVSANLVDPATGKALFKRWTVIRAGPHRVGVTGVSEDFLPRRPELEGQVAVKDPLTSLQEVLGELRPRSDRIVVLTRLSAASRARAAALEGVDFILGSTEEPWPSQVEVTGQALAGVLSDRGRQVGFIETELSAQRRGFQLRTPGAEGVAGRNPYAAKLYDVRLDLKEEPTLFLLIDEWRQQRSRLEAQGLLGGG